MAARDLGALASYVKFYVTVVAQLEVTLRDLDAVCGDARSALAPLVEPLAPVEHESLRALAGPSPVDPSAAASLFRPSDPEHLSGIGDVYEVVGRFTFEGDDGENLDRLAALVRDARREVSALGRRLADLARLPDAARLASLRLRDEEDAAAVAQAAATRAEFVPLADQLVARAEQTLSAVRAVPRPDVLHVDGAEARYAEYLAKVGQVWSTCLPFLERALEAVYAFAGAADVPAGFPAELPLAPALPADLLLVPPQGSPELAAAEALARELDAEEKALRDAGVELVAELARLDAELLAENTREAASRVDVATMTKLVDHASAADTCDREARAIAGFEHQKAERLVNAGNLEARQRQIEAAIAALGEELANRESEIHLQAEALDALRAKEPLMFGKDEWRARVAATEEDVDGLRATYNQRLGAMNQLKIDLSAIGVSVQTEQGQGALVDRWISDAKARHLRAEEQVKQLGVELGPARPPRPLPLADAEHALVNVKAQRAEVVDRVERLLGRVRRAKEEQVRAAARLRQIDGERQRARAVIDSAAVAATQGWEVAVRRIAEQRAHAVEQHLDEVLDGLARSLGNVTSIFLEPALLAAIKAHAVERPPSVIVAEGAAAAEPVVTSLAPELEPRLLALDASLGQIEREFCSRAREACAAAWA
ncbi:MAG: hypothetical protein IT374_23720 [Polyangiaceae bacterium]|nr:hypothetical protein [Polyangiaceae bacterium]